MASLDLDEELLKDEELVASIQNLDHSIVDIETLLESRMNIDYNSLTVEEKIKHDLLIAFALNSLYWVYLRLDGVDPTTHNIKRELDRVKSTMDMAKGAMAKKNMLRVDKKAVERVIDHALWTPEDKKRRFQNMGNQNKKIKFDENGDPSK
ncbi:PREDICTED: nuclear nucleic acid-binding protein C1D-like [Diuraphis noxia]|uniref:nuclear nucleic acid-binding protein C1D-like n=1 Tax=Diuraphis noxia TaxID=143948 RepID=UPI00076366A5|nr:PREDICTED: nuclear nucleic acid-binding protein C1D-like [Diuraphis noxia]